MRVPKKDDVIPLSKPFVGNSGKVYKELLVPKGTQIFISTTGYNMYVRLSIRISIGISGIKNTAGTRTCGDQTLMSSGRNDGLTWAKSLRPLSGFTVTCV